MDLCGDKTTRHLSNFRRTRLTLSMSPRASGMTKMITLRYGVLPMIHICVGEFACLDMMTSSNGNIFRVTGHLCGEFTGPRWILRKKASDTKLWCFLWSASESTVELTIVRLVIWDAITLIMTSLWWTLVHCLFIRRHNSMPMIKFNSYDHIELYSIRIELKLRYILQENAREFIIYWWPHRK